MTAPKGAIVKLYFDTRRVLEVHAIVRSGATGRCYRIVEARRQEKGKHAGRWHVQGLVLGILTDEQLEGEDVYTYRWYPR